MNYDLTTLENFKNYVDKTDTTRDSIIRSLVSASSVAIEKYTRHKLRARTYGDGGIAAEIGNGNGTQRYYFREYPIISVDELYDDIAEDFAAATLKASTDYVLFKEAGYAQLSPNAVKGTTFQKALGNIKAIYTAGHEEFVIQENYNDSIDLNEGGSELNATITGGVYTATTLATAVKTALEKAAVATFTITYSRVTNKFTIASDGGILQLLWESGSNVATAAGLLLGFDTKSDDTGAVTYTADYSVTGVPESLEHACILMTLKLWNNIDLKRFMIESTDIPSGYSGGTKFIQDAMPPEVKMMLEPYIRRAI